MPAVTCPLCHVATILPDPWPHPGYTCGGCKAAVAITAPPAANPFELPEERPVRVEHRNRTRASDAFGQGFGHELGRGLAQLLLCLFVLLVLASGYAAWYGHRHGWW